MTTCSNCGQAIESQTRFCPSCGTKVVGSASLEDSLIGRTLNQKYRLLSKIGSGSMGTVYLGEHIGLQKKVALKILRPDLEVSEETLQRFQREGIAAGKFSHPNAIQIFDFDRADERVFYLAMEFVEGSNLKEFLGSEEHLSSKEALEIVRQILSALAEAHDHGIVHRDLKPENIMVMRDAAGELVVKVLDFGLSKLIHFPLGASLQTQPGRIMGTPLYMAPEQGSGEGVDHRSDLYAVGLILYELITGKPPFRGDTLTELLTKQLTQPVPSMLESNPDLDIPESLDDALGRALEKDMEDRFQSADEMLEALDDIELEDRSQPAMRRSGPRSRRTPVRRRATTAKVKQRSRPQRSSPARKFAPAGAILLVALAGAAWKFSAGAEAAAVPRVSMKRPDQRSDEEARYVRLLEESRTSLRTGDTEDALAKVVAAHEMACLDSEAFLVRAHVYRAREDDDTAKADFREALRVDSKYADAAAGIGWIELERENLTAALACFDQASDLDQGSAAAAAGRGAVHYLQGDPQAAKQTLQEATALDESEARAQFYLGKVLVEEGDVNGAIDAFVSAKRSDPLSAATYAALGRAYIASERLAEAEKQLREALNLEPDAADGLGALTDLASILLAAERFTEAIALLEGPLQRHPDWGPPRVLLATALDAEGRTSEAIAVLEKALSGGSSDTSSAREPEVRTLLGILYQREEEYRKAIEQYDAAIAEDTDLALPHLNKGLALFALERYEDAAIELESALHLDDELAFAHYSLGILYMDYVSGGDRALHHFGEYERLDGTDERVAGWIQKLGG